MGSGGIFGLRRKRDEFPVEASISHVNRRQENVHVNFARLHGEKKAEEELKQQASLLDLAR